MRLRILIFFAFCHAACLPRPTQKNYTLPEGCTLRDLVRSRCAGDTSTVVYEIPFAVGRRVLVVQTYDTPFSHAGELAVDFAVPVGTPIHAARAGVVVAAQDSHRIGGLGARFLPFGNHVVVEHADGSAASYWHLQYKGIVVRVGERVRAGQLIGMSGNTGYSAFPHLHFDVRPPRDSAAPRRRQFLPTRFRTAKGDIYLRPWRRYFRSDE